MFTIDKRKDDYGVNICGDFWEFDRLYFAIAKYIGDFGMNSKCPFPNHRIVCQALLGLSYELRKTQAGERELYMQYNGYPSHWFEDADALDQIDIELAKRDYLEDIGFFDDIDDYDDDYEIDWDDEEVQDALWNFDEESTEKVYSNGLIHKICPEAQEKNTLLCLPMAFSELLYYAFILKELLSMKDRFLEQKKQEAMDENPMIGLAEMYYYSEAQLDIDRLSYFKDLVFRAVYNYIKKDAYIMHLLPLLEANHLIHDGNLRKWTDVVEIYTKEEIQRNDSSGLCELLEEFKKSLPLSEACT